MSKRILIVEDEESIADLERDYLELSGFQVEVANDGETGLNKAMKEEFDLIILDLMLPGVDGFEICREVRSQKNTPIIMVSAKKDDIDKIWDGLSYVSMLLIEVVIHTTIVLFCMYRINVKLAIIPTLAMIFCGCIAVIMERKLGAVYEEISEENAELNTVAEENFAGVRTVKAFAKEKYEIKKFLSHNNKYYELNMKQSKVFVKYYPFFSVVTKILPLLIFRTGQRTGSGPHPHRYHAGAQ